MQLHSVGRNNAERIFRRSGKPGHASSAPATMLTLLLDTALELNDSARFCFSFLPLDHAMQLLLHTTQCNCFFYIVLLNNASSQFHITLLPLSLFPNVTVSHIVVTCALYYTGVAWKVSACFRFPAAVVAKRALNITGRFLARRLAKGEDDDEMCL